MTLGLKLTQNTEFQWVQLRESSHDEQQYGDADLGVSGVAGVAGWASMLFVGASCRTPNLVTVISTPDTRLGRGPLLPSF